MIWLSSPLFKEKFITKGFGFFKVSKVPKAEIVAADTETKLYYNDEILTEEKAYDLYKEKGQAWIKSSQH